MIKSPTTEERIWAVISHLSSLAFGIGIVLPVVGWFDQRRKSNFAAFQCLQALGYQSMGFTIWIFLYLLLIIIFLITMLVAGIPAGSHEGNSELAMRPWIILGSIGAVGFFAIYFVLPIIAAVACAFGRDFRYPIMGDRLARYLNYDSDRKSAEQEWLIEHLEFRWVAAMGHFSILVLFWGMLVPLTALILLGKQSLFSKFQSLQTLVYQAGTTLLYFAGILCYALGLFALIGLMGLTGRLEMDSMFGMVGLVIFGAILLMAMGIVLLIPLLHALGQWAGFRVLKGDDYKYPLIGRLVERIASIPPSRQENPE